MESKKDKALACFGKGFNCAQAVLSVFCEKYGMDMETALKISCGLGAGMRSGEVCGAVSGAVLVVGLKHEHHIANDKETKANCYARTEEFLNEFRKTHNTIICREILSVNVTTEEGMKQALDGNLFRTVCDNVVLSAVTILEELGY